MTAQELKDRIIRCSTELRRSFNEHNARLLNKTCADLLAASGEVFSCGQFVKVTA